MYTQPNHKARLQRAKRNNIAIPSVADVFRKFKWFTLMLVVILPIYPSLSFLGTPASAHGDYDESTIITAYNDIDSFGDGGYISETGLIRITDANSWQTRTSTASPQSWSSVTDASRTKNVIKTYTVQKGESIASISNKFGISSDAIIWVNDISANDELKIGQILKVPPVSGVVHTVRSGDTISAISAKYRIDTKDIVSVNNLKDAGSIRIGMELMIPWAIKKTPKKTAVAKKASSPKATPATKKITASKKKTTSAKITAPKTTPTISNAGLKDRYLVKYTGKDRGFVKNNCTWYVAQYKTVTWRGNANQWIRNARAAGVKTWKTPVPGSIVQFSGRGYNRRYGHVGIVIDVRDGLIIVRDMNYRKLGETTLREVPIWHRSIDGYIYVD